MIAVPIVAPTTNGALKDMRKAVRIADLVELRLDLIKDINEKNLEKLLAHKNKRVIVTDRKKRINLLKETIKLKADLIDLDL